MPKSANLTTLLRRTDLETGQLAIRPVFFRLSAEEDCVALERLLQAEPHAICLDEIHLQIRDLVKLENPERNLSDEEYEQRISERLHGRPLDEYGVWVWYPWKRTLIHLLDEEEFIRVRTVRNLYKITQQEQDHLRGKRIGVIGLSVGQSVVLALAMERVGGELRIADYDHLELSNMNRIRTGVENLALPKTVMVAREIAELDPYLQVTCFSDGIRLDNIDDFLEKDGRLDVLVEECDSVEIKILARQKAREKRIPVVMETSDRTMLDIERYDIQPDYSLFHGLIEGHSLADLEDPNKRKQILVKILEVNKLSPEALISLEQMGKTITTWPQVGTDVVSGGAICAKAIRQLLLNRPIRSGRYRLDYEKLLLTEPSEAPNNVDGGIAVQSNAS